MKIKIVRYYKDNDYYAKIKVYECEQFIAFKLKKNQFIDNGVALYIKNPTNVNDILFNNKYINDILDYVIATEVILISNSVIELQNFIEVLIKQIKNNYTHYKNSIEFEKECIKKWNEGWKEVIEFEVEYWNGIRQVFSNRDIEIGVEG